MPQLILAGIVLVLVLAALSTLPIWGVAIGLHFASALAWGEFRGSIASSIPVRGQFIRAQVSDRTVNWHLDNNSIKAYALPEIGVVFGYIAGFAFMLIVLDGAVSNRGGERGLIMVASWLAYLIASACSVPKCLAIGQSRVQRALGALGDRLHSAASDVSALHETEREIEDTARSVNLCMSAGYMQRFRDYAETNKTSLIDEPEKLRDQVGELLSAAREESAWMNRAAAAYGDATQSFRRASKEANRAGVATLIAELQSIHEALSSDNLAGLLQDRSYEDFIQISTEAKADLDRIASMAPQFSQSHASAPTAGESDLDRARAIFEVSAAATLKDVKRAYTALCNEFHPDHSEQATASVRKLAEEKFKEIGWAYDILKKHHAA